MRGARAPPGQHPWRNASRSPSHILSDPQENWGRNTPGAHLPQTGLPNGQGTESFPPPPSSAGHVGRAQVATAPHLECHLQGQWVRTRMPSPLDLPAPTLGPRQPLTMAPSEPRENDGCCCFVSPPTPPGLTHPACTGVKCILWKCR